MYEKFMKRRSFLHKAGAAALGMSMMRYNALHKNPLVENIGLQLYTLRDELQLDPMKTLEVIREAGYKQLELMDTALLSRIHPVLQEMGVAVNSTHFLSPYLTGNWEPLAAFGLKSPPKTHSFDTVLEEVAERNIRFLVFPFLFPEERGGLDEYKRLSEKLNEAGEKCKAAGVSLCYHNHSFEFQPMEESSPFDVLYQETDPDLLNFELDVFWVSVAGFDPASFIREHKSRIKLLHLKDKKEGTPQTYKAISMPKDSFMPVGAGVLDFKEILSAASEAQVAHAFVEQDESADPVAGIRQSIRYLKQMEG